MPEIYHCWRREKPVPMLNEAEWAVVEPLLSIKGPDIREYREENGVSFIEAIHAFRDMACEKYNEITGYGEQNPLSLWNYRLANYGPECSSCGHLLRTSEASYCVQCGVKA